MRNHEQAAAAAGSVHPGYPASAFETVERREWQVGRSLERAELSYHLRFVAARRPRLIINHRKFYPVAGWGEVQQIIRALVDWLDRFPHDALDLDWAAEYEAFAAEHLPAPIKRRRS